MSFSFRLVIVIGSGCVYFLHAARWEGGWVVDCYEELGVDFSEWKDG